MIKVVSPLFVMIPRKTKADRKIYLNLNVYRNLHYIVNNQAKAIYCDQMEPQLKGLEFKKVVITYRLYKQSRRKVDRDNILDIVKKFFHDALVHHKCLPDDNDDYIHRTINESGGIDTARPRAEIEIQEFEKPIFKDIMFPLRYGEKGEL